MEKIIGGIKRDCYPLTDAQMLHMYTMTFSPTHEIVNMGTGRYLKMDINLAALRESLNRAVERCESMRLRLWKEPETGQVWQYVMPYENQYFEYYDFSQWDMDKVNEVMNGWTSQPFETFGGALSRIVIVSMPDGYNGYYMNMHHMAMDASSIVTFTRDVMDIYCYLMYDHPYPKPMTSYIEAVKQDLKYQEGNRKKERDMAYWQSQFELLEPIYTDFTGPGRLQTQRQECSNPNMRAVRLASLDAAGATIRYELDVNSTMKLVNFCEENGFPVSVLLLHGLRTVLSKFNNNEKDICIKDFVSRRSTVLNKKCGGVRMHCMTLRTIIEPTDTVIEALTKIDNAQNELFRHSDYGPMPFYIHQQKAYGLDSGYGYESVGFTYQPATLKSIVPHLKGIPYKSHWYSSGRQPQPLYLTAMHRPGDGGLDFHFGYMSELATPKEIEFLYYYLGRILFRSIENPNATIQEIMDMV